MIVILGILMFSDRELHAERVDYSTDKVLLETRINTTALASKPVTLAELFTFVEKQTKLKFFYSPDQLPMKGRITLQAGEATSLTQLFSTVSTMANIIFERHNRLIIVRSPVP